MTANKSLVSKPVDLDADTLSVGINFRANKP